MTVKKKKAAPKKKAVKKKPGSVTGKKHTKTANRKRNKNNLTDHEQAFADALLQNKDGATATDIVLSIRKKIKRVSARVIASNWMADERINEYMDMMRARVEDQVEYDLVKWRKDVLDLIDIAMGRKETEQVIEEFDPDTGETLIDSKTKLPVIKARRIKAVDAKNAKASLELIAKQMKLLTDKTEIDLGEQLREIFSKVAPTTGPPSQRGEKK
jgi:phage terminase small subunit